MKKIREIEIYIKQRLYNIFISLFDKYCDWAPIIKGKIVFSSFDGKGFCDNPKYIAQEILQQNLQMDLVWLVKDLNEDVPEGIRKVQFSSRKMKYELYTAQFIINNVKTDLPYRKKKGQYYIQTWHGGFPMKFIEAEFEEKLNKGYVAASKRDSAKIDLLLASCSIDKEIMQNHFWYDGEIMMRGIPRNDVYFKDDNSDIVRKVRKNLNISEDCCIALYAPTFRNDNCSSSIYTDLDVQRLIDCLNTATGKKWVVVIRLHPNVSKLCTSLNYTDLIIEGTSYSDSQELIVASNLLITDYSSIMYDFAIMKKPVFLFANDLDSYRDERGLRPIFNDLPFPLCTNNNELLNAIICFDPIKYSEQLKWFCSERIQIYDKGHASEEVVNRIKEVMKGTFKIK